jgi:2-polyprenyl-3-methyl-5-hydroxy-6-metoxy-1,4-benzoquinol methylase
MIEDNNQISIDHWLEIVRLQFFETDPQLLNLFEVYAEEAKFGRRYIDADLVGLPQGAKILEVGAGSLLLSCQLVREGFEVTALEPTGDGFSHFDQMQRMVLLSAQSIGCCPKILDLPAEKFNVLGRFEYAFSINVMEHVSDVSSVLEQVGRSLTHGACYRFTCPNYIFPYEPHFNMPTLFSKRLTELVLRRKIFGNSNLPDPAGTWKSLNWINVLQIKQLVRKITGLKVTFNQSILTSTFERIERGGIYPRND